jgi:hypothetical protein
MMAGLEAAGLSVQAQAQPRFGTGARPRALTLYPQYIELQKRSARWLLRDL